jgi:hypothetical protein
MKRWIVCPMSNEACSDRILKQLLKSEIPATRYRDGSDFLAQW